MEKFLKNRQFFYILTLICLAGFLILPKICLAEGFETIDLKEIGKYLALPEDKVENLLHSLINIFYSEWTNLMASGYSTAEEMAVPIIMKKVIQVQALNHLLIDAPIQITWAIIQNATKIARVFLVQDPSGILNELEKESVKKAVAYGMSVLFENEIRISPGAIEFKYISQKEEKKAVLFQYIIIYQPSDSKRGEILIRFYSPDPFEPPKNKGSGGGIMGFYTELTHDLPPFIVDVHGTVEDYKWVDNPSIEIDFPPEVPDLGIRPLSFWEKYVLKPIESTIKDVEIIITKTTGKSLGLTDIWDRVKSFISKITSFLPAAVVETEVKEISEDEQMRLDNILNILPPKTEKLSSEKLMEVKSSSIEEKESEVTSEPEISLEELQEMLDDIAERIDILTQKLAELIEAKKQQTEEEIDEIEEEEILDEDLDKKEKEDDVCFKSININTASKKELQKITGVGPVIAQRIIEARHFYSLNDLIRVKGIGEKTLQNIINQDCAYIDESYSGYGGGGSAPVSNHDSSSSPQIALNYSEENPVNKEIKVELSASNLKSATYDVKISIENGTTTLSEIYNEKINDWQSSYKYATSTFSGTSFSGNFKLKIKDSENNFRGKADILARVRENGKSSYLEFKGKINITDPEQATSTPTQDEEGQKEQLPGTVVINEIAWMGTKANSADEWIELYNNTTSTLDLVGLTLVWIHGTTTHSLTFSTSTDTTTTISAQGFFLLERSDDKPTDIPADQFFTGALDNNGGKLELRNASSTLIDLVDCSSGWFAGTAAPNYISMERISATSSGATSTNWANNNLITRTGLDAGSPPNKINGTPKAENSVSKSQTEISQQNLSELFEQFDKITLTYYGDPYITSGLKVPENKTLSIEPGVILQFREGYQNYEIGTLIVEGALLATSSQEKIVFTSAYDENYGGEGLGDRPWEKRWRGIRFHPTGQDSELENILVRYAGYNFGQEYSRGVVVEDTSIKIKNSVIENSATGLYLKNSNSEIENLIIQDSGSYSSIQISGGSPIIKDSIFKNNLSGIIIEEESRAEVIGNYFEGIEYEQGAILVVSSTPILKNNSGKNNKLNGIYLFGSTAEDWTLYPNDDFPYVILQLEIVSSSTLTINPGVVVKFEPYNFWSGNDDNLIVKGKIEAIGSPTEKIVFTSIDDDEYGGDTKNDGATTSIAYWNRIHFTSGASSSIFENVFINYGGISCCAYLERGVVYIENNIVNFENVHFKDNGPAGYTLFLENSTSTIRNSIFENSWIAINIVGQDQNVFENNNFQNCNCYVMKDNQCVSP